MRLPTFYEQNLIPNWGKYAAKICGKSGTAKKHSESVKNQRMLKIKDLCLVGHSKLWLVIRL